MTRAYILLIWSVLEDEEGSVLLAGGLLFPSQYRYAWALCTTEKEECD